MDTHEFDVVVVGAGIAGSTVSAALAPDRRVALIEAAQACGLSLAGGADGNDPLRATSRGVGELIATHLGPRALPPTSLLGAGSLTVDPLAWAKAMVLVLV